MSYVREQAILSFINRTEQERNKKKNDCRMLRTNHRGCTHAFCR